MAELAGRELAAAVAGALDVVVDGEGVRPWRLDAAARRYAPPTLALMSEFAAGVRLRLVTAATTLRIEASVTRLVGAGWAGPAAPAPFVAVVDGAIVDRVDLDDTGLVFEELVGPARTYPRREARRSDLELRLGGGGERLVEVWLPQDAAVLLHRVVADAPLRAADADPRPRWVHYGSSISHGASAGVPTGTWPALAATALGVDGVNLGFGGNAMIDALVAGAIARTPADLISLKLGINPVAGDAMRWRTFVPAVHAFLDIVRAAHPETPLVLVTAIASPPFEDAPGPVWAGPDGTAQATPRPTRPGDGTLTLRIARDAVAQAHAERAPDDPNLHLIDGLGLLGVGEAELLPDLLHPSPAGHALIAERIVPQLAALLH